MLDCDGVHPLLLQGQGSGAVVSVQQARGADESPQGWLGAGLASGHAAVVDARCGALSAFWQAHEAGLTALSCCGCDMLLTGSQVLTGSHPSAHSKEAYHKITLPLACHSKRTQEHLRRSTRGNHYCLIMVANMQMSHLGVVQKGC